LPEARQRCLRAGEHVHVFLLEIAAFRTDQDSVDGLRVALRELKLPLVRQFLVTRNPHDYRVTSWNAALGQRHGLAADLFDFEVALLLTRRLLGRRLLLRKGARHCNRA